MILHTEHITESHRFWPQINALAREAFPPEEYLAPAKLVEMAEDAHFDFLALIDQERFVGFMAVLTHERMAYLFFLAIDPANRSMGYGTSAIETLRARYPDKEHTVDFEMPDEASANNAQRIKRRSFYLRNGYHETGLYLTYFGVDYEVFSTNEAFEPEDFKEMMQTIPIEGFDPVFFRKWHET